MTLRIGQLTVERGNRPVLAALDLAIAGGTLCGLLGPNGAGKSTLLRVLAGLLPQSRGTLVFEGKDLATLSLATRARLVGYLPQSPRFEWPLTVEEAVALAPQTLGLGAAGASVVAAALASFDLAALAGTDATQLSGGEQMRVHLARLAAGGHRLLLVDEPVASLEPRHQLAVLTRLKAMAAQGATILAVLHDLPLAARFCDEVAILENGRLQAAGPPAAVLTDPLLQAVFGVEGVRTAPDATLVGVR